MGKRIVFVGAGALGGYVAARVAEISIPAPIQGNMHQVMKRVESGELKQGPSVIEGI
jgi:ketopantoate reductase